MDCNEQAYNIKDQLDNIDISISTLDDRIKAFNRKLATGKADSMIRIEKIDEGTKTMIKDMKANLHDMVHEKIEAISPRKDDTESAPNLEVLALTGH